jgi:hypothetical protein
LEVLLVSFLLLLKHDECHLYIYILKTRIKAIENYRLFILIKLIQRLEVKRKEKICFLLLYIFTYKRILKEGKEEERRKKKEKKR